MRGADLESSGALLRHIARHLAGSVHELSSVADEPLNTGQLWAWAADIAALIPLVEILIDRENFPT
jgi:hypothetical protein